MSYHDDDCSGDCRQICDCGRGSYPSCRYRSCYECFLERASEYTTCINCGRWHSPQFDVCFKCSAATGHREGQGRDDAAASLRLLIKWRDDFTCQQCGIREGVEIETNLEQVAETGETIKPRKFAYMQVDHIIPCAKGGRADEWNLQLLCTPCNQNKGAYWYPGCDWERVRTDLIERYLTTPYLPAGDLRRLNREVSAWMITGTWDPYENWLAGLGPDPRPKQQLRRAA